VWNKFDTIIFNPPYLPDDEMDKDIALDGGKFGHEIIERFLSEAKKYLNANGIILIIFSSKTGKEQVDSLIEKNGFKSEELEKIHVFFEDIYCYKLATC
jgi:release factor glutamine methyltransferase